MIMQKNKIKQMYGRKIKAKQNKNVYEVLGIDPLV